MSHSCTRARRTGRRRIDEEDTSTHKCTIDWGPVGGSDLEVHRITDIDTERGGIGRAVIGRDEDAVDEIVSRKLDRGVSLNRLRQTASQQMGRKQYMKGERTATERRLASPGLPIAGLRTRVSPTDVESSDILTAMRV